MKLQTQKWFSLLLFIEIKLFSI